MVSHWAPQFPNRYGHEVMNNKGKGTLLSLQSDLVFETAQNRTGKQKKTVKNHNTLQHLQVMCVGGWKPHLTTSCFVTFWSLVVFELQCAPWASSCPITGLRSAWCHGLPLLGGKGFETRNMVPNRAGSRISLHSVTRSGFTSLNPPFANPGVAEKTPRRSLQSGVAGIYSPLESPTDSHHFPSHLTPSSDPNSHFARKALEIFNPRVSTRGS